MEFDDGNDGTLAAGIAVPPTKQLFFVSRALSLRHLVSGYECGRIIPAGVGSGSPSKDAANWLSSRLSR